MNSLLGNKMRLILLLAVLFLASFIAPFVYKSYTVQEHAVRHVKSKASVVVYKSEEERSNAFRSCMISATANSGSDFLNRHKDVSACMAKSGFKDVCVIAYDSATYEFCYEGEGKQ